MQNWIIYLYQHCFKKTLVEKMEIEFDMQAIADYESKNSHDTYTHEELKDTLGL